MFANRKKQENNQTNPKQQLPGYVSGKLDKETQHITPRTNIIQQTGIDSWSLFPGNLLQLQPILGNQEIGRLIQETSQYNPIHTMQKKTNTIQRIIFQPDDFEGRPNEPQLDENIRINDIQIPDDLIIARTKHHIIPGNRIRDFVRNAAANGHLDIIQPLLLAAARTMISNSPLVNGVRMQGAETLDSLQTELENQEENQRNGPAVEEIISAIFWMPGNIFIGPKTEYRVDDPGENFETYAVDAVGEEVYNTLLVADREMTQYGNQATEEKATHIVNLLLPIASIREFHQFNLNFWTYEELQGIDSISRNDRFVFKLRNTPGGLCNNVYNRRVTALRNIHQTNINPPQQAGQPHNQYENDSTNDEDMFLGGLFD